MVGIALLCCGLWAVPRLFLLPLQLVPRPSFGSSRWGRQSPAFFIFQLKCAAAQLKIKPSDACPVPAQVFAECLLFKMKRHKWTSCWASTECALRQHMAQSTQSTLNRVHSLYCVSCSVVLLSLVSCRLRADFCWFLCVPLVTVL